MPAEELGMKVRRYKSANEIMMLREVITVLRKKHEGSGGDDSPGVREWEIGGCVSGGGLPDGRGGNGVSDLGDVRPGDFPEPVQPQSG